MINAIKLNEERYRRIWTKRNAKKASNSVPVFWSRAPRMQRCQKSRKASLKGIKIEYSMQWCWNLTAQLSLECSIWGFTDKNSGISDPIPEQDWQIVDTVLPARICAELPVVQSYPIIRINWRFFFIWFEGWNLRPTQWTRDGVEETPAFPDLKPIRFIILHWTLLGLNISCRSDVHRMFSILSHVQDKSGNHRYSSSPRTDFDFSHSRNIVWKQFFLHESGYFFWKSVRNWNCEYLEHKIYVRPFCLAVAGAYRNPTIGFTIGFSFKHFSNWLSDISPFRVNGKPCR